MDTSDFDELFEQAGQMVRHLRVLYKDVVGEDLDLESALKNYPLIVIGLAAGAGALGGWWVARRRPALPPPPAISSPEAKTNPLGYIERFFPGQVERVRDVLPEGAAEEAAQAARSWFETVLEPKLRDGADNVSREVTQSRFGAYLRQTIKRLEGGEDQTLDDPAP